MQTKERESGRGEATGNEAFSATIKATRRVKPTGKKRNYTTRSRNGNKYENIHLLLCCWVRCAKQQQQPKTRERGTAASRMSEEKNNNNTDDALTLCCWFYCMQAASAWTCVCIFALKHLRYEYRSKNPFFCYTLATHTPAETTTAKKKYDK